MEASCKWLLNTLQTSTPSSLASVHTRHHARDDPFDLAEILSFLPEKQHIPFCAALHGALKPSLEHVSERSVEAVDPHDEHVAAIRAAIDIAHIFVHNCKQAAPPSMRALIVLLHDSLLALPPVVGLQNQAAKLCEWLWQVSGGDDGEVVPQTMLFLLLRSFGGEHEALQPGGGRKSGSIADVRRVYAMRRALQCLELAESAAEAGTIRTLLLRCASSAVYLRTEVGRKFLAFLLTVEDVREAVLEGLVAQVATARKERVNFYGSVFLAAWKAERSEWMSRALMGIAEKAICAGTEPFATNLCTVLASFHANKRVSGVDLLLHRVYAPVLYKNLMVANPVVRKNAVTILVDAFPIHDPGSLMEDIEKAIDFQCGKMLDLLDDPAPIVRRATVEGVGRVVGLLWELVPPSYAKRMIDVITTKLAFDSASAQVRVAVFEALEFIARNPFAYQVLAIALPRLKSLIHDNVERVRLAFLDLLSTIKEKRKKTLRYFDVVSLEELLLRLPIESPAASTKIMGLIVNSYFPLERKGKSAEEVAASQVRACLSMLRTNSAACLCFYQNLNLYVPPGPLCEFAMGLAQIALDAPVDLVASRSSQSTVRRRSRIGSRRTKRKPRKVVDKENLAPSDPNVQVSAEAEMEGTIWQKSEQTSDSGLDRVTLLTTVADVLSSLTPSLEKEANRRLRDYIDDIFGGDALTSYLTGEGNTFPSRAVSWRIASCISPAKLAPVTSLWKKELDAIASWPRKTLVDRHNFKTLLSSLLLCGFRWGKVSDMCIKISAWSDEAAGDGQASKSRKKSTKKGQPLDRDSDFAFENRWNAVFVLKETASLLLKVSELRREMQSILCDSRSAGTARQRHLLDGVRICSAIRKGCTGAADHFLQSCEVSGSNAQVLNSCRTLLEALKQVCELILAYNLDVGVGECMSQEIRELLQWFAGADLFGSARKIEPWFAVTLCSLALGFVADAVAVEHLHDRDVGAIKAIARNVCKSLDTSEPSRVVRPVVELMRTSHQLDQRALQCTLLAADADDEILSVKQDASSELLRRGSKVLLSTACEILASCRVSGEQMSGRLGQLNVTDEFMLDTIASMLDSPKCDVPESVMPVLLRSCFEDAELAEQNLLAATLCNAVRGAVLGTSRNASASPSRIYKGLVSFMGMPDSDDKGIRAVANFSCFLVSALSEHYHTSMTRPSQNAREFFVAVDYHITNELSSVCSVTEHTGAIHETVGEILESLSRLKKMCSIAESDPLAGDKSETLTPKKTHSAVDAQ